MYEQVEELVWLEDPSIWPYVRQDVIKSRSHKSIIEKHGWKLLGYENVKKVNHTNFYSRRVWYLEKEDYDYFNVRNGYKNKPVNALKLSEIKKPKGACMVMAYAIEKLVPEYSQVEKSNELWRIANYNRIPFIGIHRYGDYGILEYDMVTTDYKLKKEACNRINYECRDLIKQVIYYSKFIFPSDIKLESSIGQNSGKLPVLRIFECRILTKLLKPIIENKENWIKPYE